MIARAVSALVGVWLMLAPAALAYSGPPADNARIVGPLVASLSAVAMTAATRPVRWALLVPGGWLLVSPWLLSAPSRAAVSELLSGVVLILLSFVRGRVDASFGGGWRSVVPGLRRR